MRTTLTTSLTIAAAAALLIAGDALPKSVETPTGQLVFQRARGQDKWFRGGTWDIVAMRPDGSAARVLAKDAFEPAASRDGRSIAFLREAPGKGFFRRASIWVMNSDGSGQRRITVPNTWLSPAWSADGKTLFVARYRSVNDGEEAIFSVRRSGAGIRRMTAWGSCRDGLDASPDGRLIAFESYSCDRPHDGDIEAVDMGGRSVPILSSLTPPADSLDWPGDPAWSPGGSLLAFSRIEWLGGGGAYVAKVDGSNVRRLSPSRLQASSPAWSADGAWLALVRDRVLDRGYPGDIWVARSDGTGLRRLTNTETIDERNVTWLHSGR